MADNASPAMSSPNLIQTPPDSPQDATEMHTSSFNDNALRLRLKTLDERVFNVEAASSMSVADFRAKVALATAIPASRQRLIYRGKLMKDGAVLATYDLQDGHTVHLVVKLPATTNTTHTDARPREVNGPAWNLANLRSVLRRTGESITTSQPLPMLRELLGDVAETPRATAVNVGLSNLNGSRHLNATPADTSHEMIEGMENSNLTGLNNEIVTSVVDLEHMTQGILTMRTVLSTAISEQERDSQQQDERIEENEQQTESQTQIRRSSRQFFVGQWLDVKDTVNQWLESTVMDIADGKILIHYHGWPTRWDEWIDVDSDRIAAFRTRTLHTHNAQRMSPVPTTRVPSAPRVGDNDVRQLVINVRNLMGEMMPHINRLAVLCEEDLQRDQIPSVDSVPSASTTLGARESEVSEVAHLVAPLFDRFGRLLIDSANHLDPLLRPELQGSSQRQRMRHTLTSRRGNGENTQLQATADTNSAEDQDNALLFRDLIATSPNVARESSQSRRSIDVHIHAIVAPASLSAFASLAQGNNVASNSGGGPRRRVQSPSTPPIGRSFATLDDIQTIEDESDQSRVPLLDAYRRRSHSESSQQRAVARDLDNFLSNDFIGSSFGHDNDEHDSDDESNHSFAMEAGQLAYRSLSSSSHIVSPRTPQSGNSPRISSNFIGVIPEVAAAEERLREAEEATAYSSNNDNGSANGRTSSTVAEPSTSSPTAFPSFLEVLRRTLSGVRSFVHSDESSSSFDHMNDGVQVGPSHSLTSELDSSVSVPNSSFLSTPPLSPLVQSSTENLLTSPSDSSIDEELDLDEVD
ncbi:Ubiquitin-like protein, regulator of apoptosis [Plasmopara halstedii]|uniref:Ubiquitin-like protein, regulator of apoptosis n=1 Tax=Plasmopara halstedii TaxID=4781 RepID=A0A0P1B6K0_PLAHL|nr:Ubiquitin-like protein, regulator of apoptosis [Plasmopara halstedii]CEG50016.1 Ubiquitin-like protein, regulator of apoptosis [Plasmopara halstedii]|eukprot:XP_024586385.1 Ubiquitin-like protein, regulator of apoptosis [Plasmopara halstedii]